MSTVVAILYSLLCMLSCALILPIHCTHLFRKRRFMIMDIFTSQPSPTRRLTIFYICALCSVALLAILGQAIIQVSIQQQTSDAFVINIAGRQRMLSQKIPKDALILETTTDPTVRTVRTQE